MAIASLPLFGFSTAAKADIITYILSGTNSGQIGTTTFTNALITLSLTGNTSGVINPQPGIFANFGTGMITISGIGTTTVTDPLEIVASATPNPLGDLGTFPFVLVLALEPPTFDDGQGFGGLGSNGLLGYDLKSAIGPLTAAPGGVARPVGSIVHTALGNLTFTSDLTTTATGTFRAVVTTTPEPSSFVLLIAGTVLVAGVRSRRAGRQRR
jgi:hypothetical protein